ncbi:MULTISPECIES: methyltransferase domain-containing protein [unclassified Mesotoga]|uniref:methyltransferase domain-containing protein n=1 Tax=unclassified Mesotoga TaxID=1184398 RepID=UPI000DA647B0|nr:MULTISPECIES: methyltransferase domain-containing protein [unclassified Mesotoga]PZC52007.1 hypothetical protein LH53_07510 [Mesotoga sp. TolDC]
MSLNWIDVTNIDIKTLLLLEKHNISHFARNHSCQQSLAIVLKINPEILWYFKTVLPDGAEIFERMVNETSENLSREEIRKAELEVLKNSNDWVVYIVDPSVYDSLEFTEWDDKLLTDLVEFSGKRVVDLGAGTGRLSFVAVNEEASVVYAVEPMRTLREYLKKRAKVKGLSNFFVVDGLIEEIPFEKDFADVVISGHVFGDFIEDEFCEMHRVTRNGGDIVLFPGNSDSDNEIHQFLIKRGFRWGKFQEPGVGYVRWYHLEVHKKSF